MTNVITFRRNLAWSTLVTDGVLCSAASMNGMEGSVKNWATRNQCFSVGHIPGFLGRKDISRFMDLFQAAAVSRKLVPKKKNVEPEPVVYILCIGFRVPVSGINCHFLS